MRLDNLFWVGNGKRCWAWSGSNAVGFDVAQDVDAHLGPTAFVNQSLALMGRTELIVVEKAGHLPTLEQPVATNAALSRGLAKTRAFQAR